MFMVQKLLELASYIESKWSSLVSNLQSLLVRSQLDICLLPSSRPEQSVDFGHVTMTRNLHRLFELLLVDLNISDGESLSLSSILFTVCSVVSVTLLMAQKLVPLGWDAPSVSWAAQRQVGCSASHPVCLHISLSYFLWLQCLGFEYTLRVEEFSSFLISSW